MDPPDPPRELEDPPREVAEVAIDFFAPGRLREECLELGDRLIVPQREVSEEVVLVPDAEDLRLRHDVR